MKLNIELKHNDELFGLLNSINFSIFSTPTLDYRLPFLDIKLGSICGFMNFASTPTSIIGVEAPIDLDLIIIDEQEARKRKLLYSTFVLTGSNLPEGTPLKTYEIPLKINEIQPNIDIFFRAKIPEGTTAENGWELIK